MPDDSLDYLDSRLNRNVTVALKDRNPLRGKLISFDAHMNLVLDPPREDGAESSGTSEAVAKRTLVRGSTVVYVQY